MTLYHVPHMALGAEMTGHFEERTSIVAYRQAFGYVGMILAGGIGLGLFFADARGGRLNADAYPPFALVLGVLMTLTIWISAWGTRREIPHLPRPSGARGERVLARLFSEMRSAFRNTSFRWLFAGVLVIYVMVGLDTALALYMYEFFWELSGGEIFALLAVYPVGMIGGAFLTRAIHRRFDKKPALMFGTAGWATCQLAPVLLRLFEVFPENGTSALLPALIGFRVVQGLVVQQALVSFGSMMADVTDEHELATGRRQEGIFFGAVAFSGKAASGVGSMLAGVSLDLIAWPTGVVEVPAAAVMRLGVVYGPATAALAAVSVWCYAHYGLTRERHRVIAAELRGG
jgi:Na+/melibiose symporter-like transporter